MRDIKRRLQVIEAAMAARGKPTITSERAAAGAEWFNHRIDRLMAQAEAAGPAVEASTQSEAERLAHALVWGPDETAREIVAQWKERASNGLKRLRWQ